jgi:hypothetical protein
MPFEKGLSGVRVIPLGNFFLRDHHQIREERIVGAGVLRRANVGRTLVAEG